MKNHLLYSLVGLMVISLAGIIVLQSIWVAKAIEDQEKEFGSLANAALNDVNESIDENEALFFLKDELANLVDSLKIVEFIEELSGETSDSIGRKVDGLYNHTEGDTEQEYSPTEKMEKVLEQIEVNLDGSESQKDSIMNKAERTAIKFKNITTAVRRLVMDHDFSGDISDRISFRYLDSLVTQKLSMQGIDAKPELAVLEIPTGQLVANFATEKYDKDDYDLTFKKKLFPNEPSIGRAGYELAVQFNGTNGFVWYGIKSIVLLCVFFTALILVCFVYSLHLIFKQKRMSQVKNDFINNMTHELKTPLASISLAASSIEHPNVIENPAEIQRFVKIIQSEKQRMNEHVEHVLDMAALDYQELKMNPEPIELIALIHESIEHVQLAVEDSNGKIGFSSQLESVLISADRFHLLSAFINILDNSVKYSKKELEIQIKLTEESNTFVIEFTDNGIGMKKIAVKQAFDKFYREETGNIHTRKGFGLGLSYVKSIIELHEGSIELTSESGRGTVVRIKLPKS